MKLLSVTRWRYSKSNSTVFYWRTIFGRKLFFPIRDNDWIGEDCCRNSAIVMKGRGDESYELSYQERIIRQGKQMDA